MFSVVKCSLSYQVEIPPLHGAPFVHKVCLAALSRTKMKYKQRSLESVWPVILVVYACSLSSYSGLEIMRAPVRGAQFFAHAHTLCAKVCPMHFE
jgi:hypothetical protein